MRIALAATAVLLAALDLGLKIWAERALADGSSVNFPVVDLRLAFNSGIAFSLGDSLPGGVVLGVAGLVIAGLIVVAWKAARSATPAVWMAMAAVLAGAVGNLADRAVDGVVTDYLHTGWFPTFNLADAFITVGAAGLALTSFRNTEDSRGSDG
ncbi:signal peptidase II [Amycolatopsis thermoflava]|uniref:signal peptidase II n=1 Tax=Amycolatopsis thermoflava TaxID=84480 RepID=UPI0037FE5C1D